MTANFMFSESVMVSPGDSLSWSATNPITGEPLLIIDASEIDPDLARDHAAFAEMELDLMSAARVLAHFPKYKEEADADVRQALFTDAVIAYCRSFNRAYGRGYQLSCSEPWVLADEQKRHVELVHIRDKVIAHSDRNSKFSQITSYFLTDSIPPKTYAAVAPIKMHIASVSDEDASETRAHILAVAERVRQKVNHLAGEITKKAFQPIREEGAHSI